MASLALASLLAPLGALAQSAPLVVLFGDSILAGYGLPPEKRPAAALQAELDAMRVSASVRNASVPGSTSSDGRGRMKSVIRKNAAVCVVQFGGNDRMHGYPPAMIAENLQAIIDHLKTQDMRVILCGPETPNDSRAAAYNAIYPKLAEETGVLFYPDLFAGVLPSMLQGDGHPNAEGARVIAHGLALLIAQALASRA